MSTNSNGAFPLSAAAVIVAVAAAYQLEPAELVGYSRRRPRPEARLVVYRLLHDECRLGWTGVAHAMNRHPGGWLSVQARKADPDAVAALRARMRPDP